METDAGAQSSPYRVGCTVALLEPESWLRQRVAMVASGKVLDCFDWNTKKTPKKRNASIWFYVLCGTREVDVCIQCAPEAWDEEIFFLDLALYDTSLD